MTTYTPEEITVSSHQRSALQRRTTTAAALATMGVLIAACGSSASSGGGGTVANGGTQPNIATQMGSVSGKVASVGSAGAKVTTSTGSTNVVFGTSTQFSQVSTASQSAVAVGDCISVASKSRRPTATTIAATSITVTSTTKCATPTAPRRIGTPPGGTTGSTPGGGLASPDLAGGGATPPAGGQAPGGTYGYGGGAPGGGSGSGSGSGSAPGGAPNFRRAGGFGGAMGTIKSISGSKIVIASTGFTAGAGAAAVSRTITTTGATTYQQRATATASDVKTGVCLSAIGQKPGTDLDAFTVTISEPVNGKCAVIAGAGGFGFGGPPSLSTGAPANG